MSLLSDLLRVPLSLLRNLPFLIIVGGLIFITYFGIQWYEDTCGQYDSAGECIGEEFAENTLNLIGGLIVGTGTGVGTWLFNRGKDIGNATFPAIDAAGTGLANLTRRLKFW
tara:strand:- start:3289 stop:3624 length:336 start_codon:yes stop_codon:yes gene_type:complete